MGETGNRTVVHMAHNGHHGGAQHQLLHILVGYKAVRAPLGLRPMQPMQGGLSMPGPSFLPGSCMTQGSKQVGCHAWQPQGLGGLGFHFFPNTLGFLGLRATTLKK
jgi:hypothetical protein